MLLKRARQSIIDISKKRLTEPNADSLLRTVPQNARINGLTEVLPQNAIDRSNSAR